MDLYNVIVWFFQKIGEFLYYLDTIYLWGNISILNFFVGIALIQIFFHGIKVISGLVDTQYQAKVSFDRSKMWNKRIQRKNSPKPSVARKWINFGKKVGVRK